MKEGCLITSDKSVHLRYGANKEVQGGASPLYETQFPHAVKGRDTHRVAYSATSAGRDETVERIYGLSKQNVERRGLERPILLMVNFKYTLSDLLESWDGRLKQQCFRGRALAFSPVRMAGQTACPEELPARATRKRWVLMLGERRPVI